MVHDSMALEKNSWVVVLCVLILILLHGDDSTVKKLGCENQFVLVKVQTWVNGIEDTEFVGAGACGNCTFIKNAITAQMVNASAILIIFYNMVCGPDETDLNIHIPAFMLSQDASRRLEILLMSTSSDKLSTWAPKEAAIEKDKLLKEASDVPNIKAGVSGVVYMNVTGAVLSTVIAPCFLFVV
ncbi:hypothetical protein TanjilG_22108 [Lupinus angustifolius]|uniref:Expansin-like EG45 domain-containing protein n=1 Tax=Lupinus angustifolius TaxID=3871 RepID=A0A4P1QU78_LUPAN|nr:hypothetical protein TanjilG_22108 [Lupinus angustifolius]